MTSILADTMRQMDQTDQTTARLDALVNSRGTRLNGITTAGDEETLKRLAELPVIDYERSREESAEKLGVRVSVLDSEVLKRRPQGNDADGLIFPNDAPTAEAVDGAALLGRIAATFRRFVALPKHAETVLALWTLHTYALDAASHTPIIALTSPTQRCGKTTTEAVLSALTNRALPASNVTSAVVFRAIEKWHPTLIIDEADSFLRDNEGLRGVLNSGHSRGTAFVLRNTGDDFEPTRFSTWCPKAIALIGKLSATLADRSIEINLRRRLPSETVEQFRPERFNGSVARSMALRWVADHLAELRADIETPAGLNDRAADNWRPLLAIAALAGASWPEKAKAAAVAFSGEVEEETAGVQLLVDVAALFHDRSAKKLSSVEIVQALVELEDRPWPEWSHGKPLTVRQLARLLHGFQIKPKLLRDGSQVSRGYTLLQFSDALARYTPPSSVTPLQPGNDATSSNFQSVTPEKSVTLPKFPQANTGEGCNAVTDGSPLPGVCAADQEVF